jgi:hypothetical protein
MHRHLFGSNDHTIICWNEGGDEHNALVGKNKIAKPSARSEGQFHMHAVTYRHAPEYRAISSETVDPKMLEPRRHAVADFFCEQLAAVFGNDIYLSQTRHGSIVFPLEVDEHCTPQYFRMLLQHIDNLMKTTWKRCCIDGPHKDIGARGESGNQVGHPKSYDEVDAIINALNIPYQTPTYSIAIQKDHDGGVFVAMQPHFFNHSGGMETLGHVITRISDQKCSPLSQEVIAERKVYAETLYE